MESPSDSLFYYQKFQKNVAWIRCTPKDLLNSTEIKFSRLQSSWIFGFRLQTCQIQSQILTQYSLRTEEQRQIFSHMVSFFHFHCRLFHWIEYWNIRRNDKVQACLRISIKMTWYNIFAKIHENVAKIMTSLQMIEKCIVKLVVAKILRQKIYQRWNQGLQRRVLPEFWIK